MSPDSVHRSLRRWVSLILQPPWTVTLQEKYEDPGDDRPVAVVTLVDAPATTFARATIPAGDRRRVAPFAVTAYLEKEETARESRLAAFKLADLFDQAVTVGLVEPAPDPPVGELRDPDVQYGGPLTLPLWDYTDVDAVGPDRAGPVDPVAGMDVVDFGVRPIPDPEDPMLWTVAMTMRLGWWSGGRSRINTEPDPVASVVAPTFVP